MGEPSAGTVGIVTGVASGIEAGIAQRLARDDMKGALFDLDMDDGPDGITVNTVSEEAAYITGQIIGVNGGRNT